MSEPIKTDRAFDLLRQDILNGVFIPGQPLPVSDLSDRYGLSATPLREALSRLAEKQLVVASANRGWRVAPVSLAEFEDISRARHAIESALLDDAMAQGGLDWESGIVGAHHRLKQTVPPLGEDDTLANRQRWIAAHDAFHTALLGAARSAWLKGFYTQTVEQLQRHHQAVLFHTANRPTPRNLPALLRTALSVDRHTQLMTPVLVRDRAAAQAELARHIETTLTIYRAIVGEESQDAPPTERTIA
jgi:GntR family transcriptional regulator, carbon starvation induced regulator